jgi:hypothetical protein
MQAWSNRPRHGCVFTPHRPRIGPGIRVPLRRSPLVRENDPGKAAMNASNIRRVARESSDFNPKGSRAVRVQTVNGNFVSLVAVQLRIGRGRAARIPNAHLRELLTPFPQGLRSAGDIFHVQPRESRRERALGLCDDRQDRLVENARATTDLIIRLESSSCTQDFCDADTLSLAREAVAAVRAADAMKDPFMHQRLENWFEMARREVVTHRKFARRNRPLTAVQRNIDNSSDGKEALAGKQRHGAGTGSVG